MHPEHPTRPPASVPTGHVGRFAIKALLGSGGMGLVYEAVDPALDRTVAIKVIRRELVADPIARERFLREARVASSVTDPRICAVYEVGEADGELFIVMERLTGEPLASRLRRGAAPLGEAVAIVLDVLAAIAALHTRGVVHRDLKPSNIFLTPHGVKLLDFGLARHAVHAGAETRADLTGAGVIVGTPRYMAPEQLTGAPADMRTDLFAVGAIFHELLAGRPAFDVDTVLGAMRRILDREPPSLGGAPGIEAADRVIQRALSHSPQSRYDSAAAMGNAVRALLVYCGGPSPEPAVEVRPPARSIAVLPFQTVGSDPATDEFADGMTDDVIAQLSKLRALKVIARGSVMRFKKRDQTSFGEIGERLGVRTLLDGTIRRSGSRVRIVAQLVDPASDAYIWSETYDRELTDIFNIQSEVAQQIAHALRTELTSDERARLGRKPTHNVSAYQQYLKGRHCILKYTGDGIRQGLGFLEQSIIDDPEFALGHAWIAIAHVILAMGYGGGALSPADSYLRARTAAEHALGADTELGDAHGALAFVKLVMEFDWTGSEREFRQALALSPGSDLMWSAYGLLLSALCRHEEAIAAYRRGKELDPLAAVHSSTLAATLLRAGRVDEAIEETTRLIELQPEFPMAHSTLGWAHLKRGAIAVGLAAIERAVELAPGNTMLIGQLGHAYAIAGRADEARAILARMQTLARERYVSPYHVAYVHAGLGDGDAAVDWLERAYAERAGGLYGIKGSFLFTGLSSHPRFVALLRKMNLEGGPHHDR